MTKKNWWKTSMMFRKRSREEVEEELGLDSQDDDVDYLEKSEDLLDDTDEYRNN